MSAELNAAAQTEPRLTTPTEPVDPTAKKTENNTDPDPYCCSPGDGDGGPDT
jgi:hypothetical protein